MAEPLDHLARELTDQGRLIEAGFTLRIMPMARCTDPVQMEALRNAFFAGAHHLFACMVAVLDPSTPEPTAADLEKMDAIERELTDFVMEFATRHLVVKGTA